MRERETAERSEESNELRSNTSMSAEYSENVEHGKALVRQNGQQPIS